MFIDQALQNNSTISARSPTQQSHSFPTRAFSPNNTESFSTVVEQAIITQDKPLLNEILIDCDPKLIANTVVEMNVARISGLLSLLQEFLYMDCKNTQKYCAWIQEIMVRHLGVVLSNPENRHIVARYRKFLQKRSSQRAQLLLIKSMINVKPTDSTQKDFIPKFSYVETKEEARPVEEGRITLEDAYDLSDEDMMDEDME